MSNNPDLEKQIKDLEEKVALKKRIKELKDQLAVNEVKEKPKTKQGRGCLLVLGITILISIIVVGALIMSLSHNATPRPTYTPNPTYSINPTYTKTNTPLPTLEIPKDTSLPKPPSGNPIVDVTYQLKNAPVGGAKKLTNGGDNYWWALETTVTRFQIWPKDNAYVVYAYAKGIFTTWAGKSSGGTGMVGSGVTGTSSEEEVFLVTGSLLASPNFPLTGYIGSFDMGGDQQGHTSGTWPSVGSYFQSDYKYEKTLNFTRSWITCGNGSLTLDWTASSNWIIKGDITGTAVACP